MRPMPNKSYPRTKEHCKNISEALIRHYQAHPEARQRVSEFMASRELSEETKQKLSEAHRGKKLSEEHKEKMSESQRKRYNNPNNLQKLREVLGSSKTRQRMSEAHKDKLHSPETRLKMSLAHSGSNHWNWKGGTSFEPYCPKFNERIKEQIRNRNNRCCTLCGKSEILNGERLSIHHVDGDKTQGCDKSWSLVSLCKSCHSRVHATKGQKLIEIEFILETIKRR